MARTDLKTVVSADMSQFSSTMRRVGATAAATAGKVSRAMGSTALAIGRVTGQAARAGTAMAAIGGTAVVAGMAAGLKGAADLGGQLSDLAARTGEAAGNLAIMQRALEDNGVAGDKAGTILNKMQKSIFELSEGSTAMVEDFERLNITSEELAKLSPAKQFELIGRSLSAIQDPAVRAATAMGIFGKSGGELLTLFADGGAFDGAGKFLGTQAEILNRSSVLFDGISDKLARIPAKLQGFFVGFLEPMAESVDSVLTRFEEIDFAAIGQRLSSGLSAENIGKIFSASIPLITTAVSEGFAKAFDLVGAMLQATFSTEGLSFMKDNLIDVVVAAFDAIGGAAVKFAKSLSSLIKGEETFYDNTRIIGTEKGEEKRAKTYAERLQEELGKIDFGPSARLQEELSKFKGVVSSLFPGVKSGQSSESSIYDKELEEQRKRVAADAAKMAGANQIDGTLYGPARPSIARNGLAEALDRYRSIGTQTGLGGARGLGVASGLVTGGLGEKRRLRTSKDDKDAKRGLSLQEQQTTFLEDIKNTIGKSLSVA